MNITTLRENRPLDPSRIGSLVIVAGDAAVTVAVDPLEFQSALDGTGFEKLARGVVKPHTALTRAVGNAKKGIRSTDSSTFFRVGVDASGSLIYALVRKTGDVEAKDLDARTVATLEVAADGSSGVLVAERTTLSEDEHDQIGRVKVRYQRERRSLTIGDMRRVIAESALVICRGIRIGGTSAIVLPSGDDVKFLRLRDALALAGMRVVAQEFFAGQRQAYAGDAESSLLDAASALLASCSDRLDAAKSASEDNGLRWSSLAARRTKAGELRAKCAFFESFLGVVGDDVRQAIAECESTIDECEKEIGGSLLNLSMRSLLNLSM